MRIFKYIILLYALIFIDFYAKAQCFSETRSFAAGEKVTYDAVYHWGFIWLHAGEVSFSVQDTSFHGKDSYYFDAHGRSLTSYDWLYKVRDRFQSIALKEDMSSLWYSRNTKEASYHVNNEYTWNYKDVRMQENEQTFANYCEYDFNTSWAMGPDKYFHPDAPLPLLGVPSKKNHPENG